MKSKTSTKNPQGVKKLIVLTTAMLTFIPFWKAASVVLCDFGSSAFYAGGIAMRAFGPAFPWFILIVMLFAGVMLMVYLESCGLFVRGGAYPVVKAGLGDKTAKVAVSAILFDFILTGPISSVSAGHYLAGLINSTFTHFGVNLSVPDNTFAIIIAIIITMYFWRQNIRGIEDSSDKSAKIIFASLIMCLILMAWGFITIYQRGGAALPPFTPVFNDASLGWTKNMDWLRAIGAVGILMAIGHSFLALSGLETLAQVYREIEYPKMLNLKKAAVVVFLFALIFTGGLTLLASLIIPPELVATKYHENLLSGLVMEMNGPMLLKLIMQGFVVLVGVAMLAGAVNTALIGANSILNRVAEDGILTDWFRKIHKKFGTTYHLINMVAVMQIIIIILSRGHVYLLGEAYAFGVIWSFVLESLSVLMLRFKWREEKREFMVPLNFKFHNYNVPVGATLIFLFLFSLASINLLTKKVATISGLSFTAFLYIVFYIAERINAKKANDMFEEGHREKINTKNIDNISALSAKLTKENRVLIGVKDPENLYHLDEFLKNVDGDNTDIIVLYARPGTDMRFGSIKAPVDENELFSQVILTAEKYGNSIMPMVVESNDPFYAISQIAREVNAKEIILGVSGTHGAHNQLERMVMAWGAVKQEMLHHEVVVKIIWEGREVSFKFNG